MKVKDAKRILNCSYTTLHNYVKSGKLKATRNPINNFLIFDDDSTIQLASKMKTSENSIWISIGGQLLNFDDVTDSKLNEIIDILNNGGKHETF